MFQLPKKDQELAMNQDGFPRENELETAETLFMRLILDGKNDGFMSHNP